MNVRSTALWAVAFLICDVLSLVLHGAVSTWLPVVVMVAAVIASRLLGRRLLAGGDGYAAPAT